MDSVFLKLMAGSRLSNYMGLKMAPGVEYKYGKNYMFLEIPVAGVSGSDTGLEIKRNQHVLILPACNLDIKGRNIVHVEPNPALAKMGQVQAGYNIHPDSGEKIPGFYFTARKDVNLADLAYAVRLYMYA